MKAKAKARHQKPNSPYIGNFIHRYFQLRTCRRMAEPMAGPMAEAQELIDEMDNTRLIRLGMANEIPGIAYAFSTSKAKRGIETMTTQQTTTTDNRQNERLVVCGQCNAYLRLTEYGYYVGCKHCPPDPSPLLTECQYFRLFPRPIHIQ